MRRNNAIVYYDGYCKLCNGIVGFITKHDKKNILQFKPLQSEHGQQLLNDLKIEDLDSVVFVNNDSIYTHSQAFIEMVQLLPMPINWLKIIKYLPKKIRTGIYNLIARNRYQWFGSNNSCEIPAN